MTSSKYPVISKDTTTTMNKPKVVFFGTGPVAAKSLELLSKHADIEAVVTKPKPDHHRGSYPVLDVAETLKLEVKTVSNKQELPDLIKTNPFESSIGVLIDFGIIISQDVIDYFPKGIVNSHFSLLPEWRGADPITFSILSGQKTTGVSLMLLVEKMDEGPLITYGEHKIIKDVTTAQLTQDLIILSDTLLKWELPRYIEDSSNTFPQSVTGKDVSYSRKLTKEDGHLDWTKPAGVLEREIRAFKEWPKSYTKLGEIDVVITESHESRDKRHEQPGTIIAVNGMLSIQTSTHPLVIDKLKPAGKREMTAKEFLQGYRNKLDIEL